MSAALKETLKKVLTHIKDKHYTKEENDTLYNELSDSLSSEIESTKSTVQEQLNNTNSNLTTLLNNKVDKEDGKGLSTVDFKDTNYIHTDNNFTDEEKEKLSILNNYDDSEVRELINGKSDKGHTHNLNEIVDYEALDLTPYALKEELPTKVSELENDSSYVTQSQLDETNANLSQINTDSIIDVNSIDEINHWDSTVVPVTGNIEKIYFNTSLSVDEVNQICDGLTFVQYDGNYI